MSSTTSTIQWLCKETLSDAHPTFMWASEEPKIIDRVTADWNRRSAEFRRDNVWMVRSAFDPAHGKTAMWMGSLSKSLMYMMLEAMDYGEAVGLLQTCNFELPHVFVVVERDDVVAGAVLNPDLTEMLQFGVGLVHDPRRNPM